MRMSAPAVPLGLLDIPAMQAEVRVPYVWAYEVRATLSASRESERTSDTARAP